MPAKEEEVKKYRDAAIGNAAIVEDQYSSRGLSTSYIHHHLDLKLPINRRLTEILKATIIGGCRWIVFLGLTLLEVQCLVHSPCTLAQHNRPLQVSTPFLSTPNFLK